MALLVTLLLVGPAVRGQVPSLQFSTFDGGVQFDSIRDVAADAQGNTFVTGGTGSAAFLTTSGAYDETFNGVHDVFVAKLDSAGSLVWSTLLGGPNYDRAYALEVDAQGYVYVAGRAGDGYPTTVGSVQPTFGGDVNPSAAYGAQDGFVTKLTPDGSQIVWSTFIGSNDREVIRDIDIDSSGNVYLGITSISRAHPHITSGAFQTTLNGPSDGVVAKISADGSSVIYASYFGGSGDDGWPPSIRVDSSGYAYLLTHTRSDDAPVTANALQTSRAGGWDLILAKISQDGSSLVYSTYFGGSDLEFSETHGLSIDSSGHAYITATTKSTDLPVTPGSFQTSYGGSGGSSTGANTNYPGDGFVAKISPDGSTLVAGTYLGGQNGEGIEGSAIDAQGSIFVSGASYSFDFPVSADALQGTLAGAVDSFVVKLDADLSSLLYSTYLGGSDIDHGRSAAVDTQGNIVVGGDTNSTGWPVVSALQPTYGGAGDGALAKISTSELCSSVNNVDTDGDGVADDCDVCPGFDDHLDSDGDGTADGCDLCPGFDDTVDSDADGVPDGCDQCAGFDDRIDVDSDGVPDRCDAFVTVDSSNIDSRESFFACNELHAVDTGVAAGRAVTMTAETVSLAEGFFVAGGLELFTEVCSSPS